MFQILIFLLVASLPLRAAEIPDTLIVGDQTYKSVTYQSHDASRLKIMHETGVASLPIASLPVELRLKLGFDEKAAAEAESAFQRQQQQAQAQQQAAIAQHADNQKKLKLAQQLDEKSIPVVGRIFQVVDGGVLLDSIVSTTGIVTSEVKTGNLLRPDETKTISKEGTIRKRIGPDKHVFVMTKKSGLVDGGEYSGVIYPMGTHSFTTVIGGARTVPAFSDDLEAVSKAYGLE